MMCLVIILKKEKWYELKESFSMVLENSWVPSKEAMLLSNTGNVHSDDGQQIA